MASCGMWVRSPLKAAYWALLRFWYKYKAQQIAILDDHQRSGGNLGFNGFG